MPKLWNDTIEAHRRDVRKAVLDATAALVTRHGLLSVTMSRVAEETGIGRATLYKYFPDVETILLAWHERQVADHLERLIQLRDQAGSPARRLETVLGAYALMTHHSRGHHGNEVAALIHGHEQVARAQEGLHAMIGELLAAAAAEGGIRSDVAPDELATYCLHALAGARRLSSKAAVHRLVLVTLSGMAPPGSPVRPTAGRAAS